MNYRAAGEDSGGTAASWRAADSLSMFEPFQEDRTSTLLTCFVSGPHQPENESETGENASDYTHAGPASRRPRSAGKRSSQRAADEKTPTNKPFSRPRAAGSIRLIARLPKVWSVTTPASSAAAPATRIATASTGWALTEKPPQPAPATPSDTSAMSIVKCPASNILRPDPRSPARPASGVTIAPAAPASANSAMPFISKLNGGCTSRRPIAVQNALNAPITKAADAAFRCNTGSVRISVQSEQRSAG